MANLLALQSLATSLATWLEQQYGTADIPDRPAVQFRVVSSSQLAAEDGPTDDPLTESDHVTIYLYRVTVDPYLRTAGRPLRPDMDPTPLSLQAHLLFSLWTVNPATELTTLAWLMRTFNEHPVFDASSLDTSAAWAADDVIHLIPEELTNEDMCRIWDALTPSYRLSFSYVARSIRIDPAGPGREGAPVVATRFGVQDRLVSVKP